MSLSTAATAKAQFGDLTTANQNVAIHTPAAQAAGKFAEYLAEKQAAGKPAPASANGAPRPDELAKTLFGKAFDRSTGTVNLDQVSGATRQHTAEFAGLLRQRLAAAKLDPNLPVNLSIGADHRIIVDNSNPQAADITKLFQDDPALAQAYRDVAGENDRLALLQTGAGYVKEWNAATGDSERQALWTRYSELMNRLSGTFSGRMTFGPGTATAESQQMLRRMGVATA